MKPVTATYAGVRPEDRRRARRIDDFLVVIRQADGPPRAIRRDGAVPKVEIHDPLEGHRQLSRPTPTRTSRRDGLPVTLK